MPSGAGYTWSDALDAIIRQEAAAAGVPLDLALTFIAAESSFDPLTHVDNALEDSVGLLELNRRGGQGTGYSVAQLQDPRFNLQHGLPAIRAAFEQSWRPNIDPFEFIYLVATRSGHPGPVARNDPRIYNIARIWVGFYPTSGLSLAGPGPGSHPVGVPGPTLAGALAIPASVALAPVIFAAFSASNLFSAFNVANPLRDLVDPRRILRAEDPRRLGRLENPNQLDPFSFRHSRTRRRV